MLAMTYPDDKERGNAMGLALGGLAMGVLGKSTGASGARHGGTRYKSAGVWRGGGLALWGARDVTTIY